MIIYITIIDVIENTIERYNDEIEDSLVISDYPYVDYDNFAEGCIYSESIVSQEEADRVAFELAKTLMNRMYAVLAKHESVEDKVRRLM